MRLKRSNDVPPISDKISWGPESTERLLVIVALAFGAISQIHSHYQRRSVNILRLLRACRVVTKRRAAPDESYCVGNCDRSGTLHIPLDRYPLADFPGCAGRPPPLVEIHKQMILVGIGLFQIFESKILARVGPARRNTYSVLIKILLASLLVAHTGGINSSY